MHRTIYRAFKNIRTGKIAKVKHPTEAAIINVLNARLWDKIEVIGANYHYIVIMQDDKLRLRPVYH